MSPPSHCVACSAPIRAYDNIPIVSYVVLRGRCRSCGSHIPPRDAFVELGTGILFVMLAWRLSSLWALPAYCVLGASLVAISAIDVKHMRIPTAIVYVTAALGAPLLVLASAGTHRWSALASAAIGGASAFAAFFTLFYAVPRGIGFGDVRLAGLCGGFLGWMGYREAVARLPAQLRRSGSACRLAARDGQGEAQHEDPLRPVSRRRHCDHRALRGADHPRVVFPLTTREGGGVTCRRPNRSGRAFGARRAGRAGSRPLASRHAGRSCPARAGRRVPGRRSASRSTRPRG